jgi:hypothetical protein
MTPECFKSTVLDVIAEYARKGLNSQSYLTHDDGDNLFSVFTVHTPSNKSFLSLSVRVLPDLTIIDSDRNDKPLVDALIQAGIPRQQIILAYAGEPIPETLLPEYPL